MALALGSNLANSLKLGSKDITHAYLGANEIFAPASNFTPQYVSVNGIQNLRQTTHVLGNMQQGTIAFRGLNSDVSSTDGMLRVNGSKINMWLQNTMRLRGSQAAANNTLSVTSSSLNASDNVRFSVLISFNVSTSPYAEMLFYNGSELRTFTDTTIGTVSEALDTAGNLLIFSGNGGGWQGEIGGMLISSTEYKATANMDTFFDSSNDYEMRDWNPANSGLTGEYILQGDAAFYNAGNNLGTGGILTSTTGFTDVV